MHSGVRLLFLFLLLVTGGFLISQKALPSKAALLEEYRQADKLYQQALRVSNDRNASEEAEDQMNQLALKRFSILYPKLSSPSAAFDSLRFFTAYKIGELQHYFSNENGALHFYDQALAARQNTKLEDSFLFKPYLYKGILLYSRSRFDSALNYFTAAEKVQLRYRTPLAENQRLYNTLGALYFAMGNFSSAGIYFQKALEVLSKSNPYYRELFVNYNINLASAQVMLEEYDAANQIYQKLIPLGINTDEIYHNLGVINLNLGAPQKALDYFYKAGYQSNRLVRLYNDMGMAHFNLHRLDSAAFYYTKADEANRRFNEDRANVAHGITLHRRGKLALRLHKIDTALSLYQQAIHQFFPAYDSQKITDNPQQFSGVFSYINLFELLVDKAAAMNENHTKTKDANWLKEELKTFESAFALVDYVERTYNSDEARLFLGKIKYIIHSKPIDVAFALYKKTGNTDFLQKAYFLDQKNKASVLAYTVHLQEMNSASPVWKEEKKVRTEITRLSLKALRVTDAKQLAAINADIRNQEITLGKLQEKLNRENPSAAVRIPSFQALQTELLDDKTTLLSFHLSDSTLTVFAIDNRSVKGDQKRLYPGFQTDVSSLVSGLVNRNEVDEKAERRLYQFLLGNMGKERLILVPDDELLSLPFEALKDSQGHYLVETHSVQYQYSTALLREETASLSTASTLAFAPFANRSFKDNTYHFDRLKSSTSEFGENRTTVFTNRAATKKAFLQELGEKDILHFATHAATNKDNSELSFIAFSPAGAKDQNNYLLYASEIANLPLSHTKLVILSACETGTGHLIKGEGVMSLSRAFAYAGCPNTVASLWKADDFSTAYLAKKMHHYLEKGYSIDKAVQQAKKDYLADAKINPRLKSPAYWAHLVFIGNFKPEKDHTVLWMACAVVLLVLFLLYTRHQRKRGRNIKQRLEEAA